MINRKKNHWKLGKNLTNMGEKYRKLIKYYEKKLNVLMKFNLIFEKIVKKYGNLIKKKKNWEGMLKIR